MSDKPAINTHVRLFDLVRFMRAELHDANLITDEEYVWLCHEAELANAPEGGSPSPRRLEDYDDLRAKHDELAKKADECWGAANYRLKYLGTIFRAIGMTEDNIESRISEACEIVQNMRSRIAELEKDKVRLDWMAQSYDSVGFTNEDLKGMIVFESVYGAARKKGVPAAEATRQAIDAAMAPRKEGKDA